MLRTLAPLCFCILSSYLAAGDWPVGRYVLPVGDIKLQVELSDQQGDELSAVISWPNSASMGLVAGSTAAPFNLLEPTLARLEYSTSPAEYFQLELKDKSELWLRYENEARPALNTLGRLVVDETPVQSFTDYSEEQALKELPPAASWPKHVENDLWPYWNFTTPDVFVSSRCNDASLPNLENLCWELRANWLQEGLTRDYTRMLSRQTFTYGVIFHLTGEPKALALMNEGVELILSRLQPDGSIASVLENGESIYQSGQHTSQDLAYAQVGLAMAYYLTGYEKILNAIEATKQHIFSQYKNDDWNMLAWTIKNQQPNDASQQELVAQLEQLNAYMLLVYPLLNSEKQNQWQADIEWLVNILLEEFYLPEQQRFAGQIVAGKPNKAGERHNDFGHSIKAFWMIHTAGGLLGNKQWQQLAEKGIASITEQAFRYPEVADEFSTWANQANSQSSVWWEFAELTQASATLAVTNQSFLRYLPESYRAWLGQYIDLENGGVWMFAGGGPKQHLWKNGYHESEFALVAYITTALIVDQPFSLFYADSQAQYQPYYYSAQQAQAFDIGLGRKRVLFTP